MFVSYFCILFIYRDLIILLHMDTIYKGVQNCMHFIDNSVIILSIVSVFYILVKIYDS